MAGDTKDVELRIRARDYSQKTLEQLTDTLAQLVKAQEAQVDSAKKGETSARALEKSYQNLENVGKALISQAGLVKKFENESAALVELQQRVDAARAAQKAYSDGLKGAEKITKEQADRLRANAQAVTSAEGSYRKLEARIATTSAALTKAGIDTANLGAAQASIVAGVTAANAALERQDKAINSLDGDLKKLRDTQAATNRINEIATNLAQAKAAGDAQAKAEAAKLLAMREKQLEVDRTFNEAVRRGQEAAEAATRKETEALRAQRKALDDAAAAAQRFAREQAKTARGTQGPAGNNLASVVKDIGDPTTASVKSIDGITEALDKVEKKLASVKEPIKGFAQTTRELEAAQRSLQAVAGQVDAYARQMQAVAAARREVQQARTALAELTAQARSGTGGPELVQQMSQAQTALRRASEEMGRQVTTARGMRAALREAGVDTSSLAKANEQVTAAATRTKAAVDSLTTTYQKYGAEVEKAGAAQRRKWTDGGRTTLSWAQRIRGEVLALATAYAGLQGGINLAQGAVEARMSTDTINTRLGQVVGNDPKAVQAEWDYVLAVSDRLGLSFEKTALSYSRFGVAAKSTGLDLQSTRFIFEGLAQSATVARLSTDEFERALRAVEQMMSKGQIMAEELKGQLGDALPTAMGDLAKAMGISVGEVLDQMEKGAISSEYVIDLARQWKKDTAEGLDTATNSMQAQLARLDTAQFLFKKALGDNGFIDAYTDFITKLTELLRGDQGAQLAATLSDMFTKIVEAMQWCIENIDLLKLAFSALIGVQVFGFLSKAVTNFGTMTTAVLTAKTALTAMFGTMTAGGAALTTVAAGTTAVATGATRLTTAVTLLTTAFKFLARAIPVLGAAFVAYEVYDFFANKKAKGDAKKAGEDVSKAFRDGMNGTADPNTSGKDDAGYGALGKEIERRQKALDGKMKTANLRGAKGELAERKRLVAEEYDLLIKQAENTIKNTAKREERVTQLKKLSLQAQAIEEKKFNNEQASRSAGTADKRIRMAENLKQSLERIEDDIAKKALEADPNSSFEERRAASLNLIAHEYDKVIKQARELQRIGNADQKRQATAAIERIEQYVKERQNVEGIKQDQAEINRLEQQLNTQLRLRTTIQESYKAERDAGIISEQEYYRLVTESNTTMAEGIAKAVAALRTMAEAKKSLMRPEDYQALMANLAAVTAQNNAGTQNAAVALTAAQEKQTRLMNEQSRASEKIKADQEAGILTAWQAADAQAALNNQYRARIIAQAEEVKSLAATVAATTPASREAMLGLIAEMDRLIVKTADARTGFTMLDQTIIQAGVSAMNGAFDSMVDTLGEVVSGQRSVASGFKEMGRQSLLFFAQFLRDIAVAILKQQLFNMLKSSGNPWLMAIGTAASAGSRHSGGVVNSAGNSRRVPASVFDGAPRFHDGGLPGLRANEVPTILERGEEVLTRDDPRHVLNGGSGGGQPTSQRFVLVDDRSRIAEAMNTPEGEKATLQVIRANLPTLKSWMR